MKSESPVAAIYRWDNDGTCTVEPLYRESRQEFIMSLLRNERLDEDTGLMVPDPLITREQAARFLGVPLEV